MARPSSQSITAAVSFAASLKSRMPVFMSTSRKSRKHPAHPPSTFFYSSMDSTRSRRAIFRRRSFFSGLSER